MGGMIKAEKHWSREVASCLKKKIHSNDYYQSAQNLQKAVKMVSLNCKTVPTVQLGG